MRRSLPESLIAPGHPDYERLVRLECEILARLGGQQSARVKIPAMLRECIDDVMQTAKTGRRSYAELEKTEKTYIGTRVEIGLRALLGVPRRKLDLLLLGEDVDVKHTLGLNWMIPGEALTHACILVASDEKKALCFMGLFIARPEHLSAGANQDKKRSLTAAGFRHVRWILNAEPLPPNFWRTVSQATADAIISGRSGNERVKTLFRHVQERPIGRRVVEETAPEKDFMRRIRADGTRGTRNELAREGIVLLSGAYNGDLIKALGLPDTGRSEFVSRTIKTVAEAGLARAAGFEVPWPTS